MWGFKMFMELKEMMILKWGKYYMLFCYCNNKQRFERIQLATKLNFENEILREDFVKGKIIKIFYRNL